MDQGHHILAIDDDRRALRRAQGDVQDRTILRDVDLLTPKHGVDPRSQVGFLGQLQQKLECLVGDPVFRVIEDRAQRPRPSSARRAPGSSAKSSRRCKLPIFMKWAFSAFQAGRSVSDSMMAVI